MKEREYTRLRERLEEDYRRDLESLDRVFRLSGGDPQALAKSSGQVKRGKKVDRGALSQAIDEVLPKFGSADFTAADIYQEIQRRHPDMELKESSVSSAVVRLAEDDGPLTVVSQGKGRRASIFKVKSKGARAEKAS
ncbi:MAG: hypothetical protein LAP21_27980 [Acidobacteriia bacterium]|nr:hypothetical protein [Terriglobia bacterium]